VRLRERLSDLAFNKGFFFFMISFAIVAVAFLLYLWKLLLEK